MAQTNNKITILFLAADPRDQDPLRLKAEKRAVQAAIDRAGHTGSLHLADDWGVSVADVQQLLLGLEPSVLHFSGHGSKAGQLALVAPNHKTHALTQAALMSLLTAHQQEARTKLRVVVLNACYAAEQANAITQVVDCAVGMSRAISDEAAIAFSAAFYRALAHGRSVRNAFDIAVALLQGQNHWLKGASEHLTPRLLHRSDVDPSTVFLLNDRSGQFDPPDHGGPPEPEPAVPPTGSAVRIEIPHCEHGTVIVVFLCHNSQDKPIVRQIASGLRSRGVTVWLDESDLPPGELWRAELENVIRSAPAAAVMLGSHGIGPTQRAEIQALLDQRDARGLRLIPVLLPGGPSPHDISQQSLFLSQSNWIDFSEGVTDEALNRLAAAVGRFRGVAPRHNTASSTAVVGAVQPLIRPALPGKPLHCYGRDRELSKLTTRILAPRVQPTLVLGGAGYGKSTLSLTALHDERVADRFMDARYFVRCDTASGRQGLLDQMAIALGITAASGEDLQSKILVHLRQRRTLLVLDNFETPWDAVGQRSDCEEFLAVLAEIPTLALVVTLRGQERPLRVDWGEPIRVTPLMLEPARETFLSAAGEKFRHDVFLEPLLAAVGYVPLALRILGANAQCEPNLTGIFADWQEAEKRMALMRLPASEDKQDNVQISLDLSIASPRLNCEQDAARRLFSLLGVLPAGIAASHLDDVLPRLGNTGARPLRQIELAFDEQDRLRVLPPVREYSLAYVRPTADDLSAAVDVYCRLAKEEGSKVGTADGAEAVVRLAPELANVEAMIRAGLSGADPLTAIDAACSVGEFARFTGLGRAEVLTAAASKAQELGKKKEWADCLVAIANLSLDRSDTFAAEQAYQEAFHVFVELNDVPGQAWCNLRMGSLALRNGEYAIAEVKHQEALRLYVELERLQGQANCIDGLGDIALQRNDYATAEARYNEALSMFGQVSDVLGQANCIQSLGHIALHRDDYPTAEAKYNEALSMHVQVSDVLGQANGIRGLGDIAFRRHDYATADAKYNEALSLHVQLSDVLGQANCILGLGDIAFRRHDYATAEAKYNEALSMCVQISRVSAQAGCIRGLGNVALKRRDYATAEAKYNEALAVCIQTGHVLDQAICLQALGDVARLRGEGILGYFSAKRRNRERARQRYLQSLELYGRIADAYSIGNVHKDLASVSTSWKERRRHVQAAYETWKSIDRGDLVAHLKFDERVWTSWIMFVIALGLAGCATGAHWAFGTDWIFVQPWLWSGLIIAFLLEAYWLWPLLVFYGKRPRLLIRSVKEGAARIRNRTKDWWLRCRRGK